MKAFRPQSLNYLTLALESGRKATFRVDKAGRTWAYPHEARWRDRPEAFMKLSKTLLWTTLPLALFLSANEVQGVVDQVKEQNLLLAYLLLLVAASTVAFLAGLLAFGLTLFGTRGQEPWRWRQLTEAPNTMAVSEELMAEFCFSPAEAAEAEAALTAWTLKHPIEVQWSDLGSTARQA